MKGRARVLRLWRISVGLLERCGVVDPITGHRAHLGELAARLGARQPEWSLAGERSVVSLVELTD